MKRFSIETKRFTIEVQEFVDSLNELCYSIGGAGLVDKISEEVNFRLTDGEDFIRVISDVYERVRGLATSNTI